MIDREPGTVIVKRPEVSDRGDVLPPRASARERTLRFNRSIIGLCVVALMAMFLLPV